MGTSGPQGHKAAGFYITRALCNVAKGLNDTEDWLERVPHPLITISLQTAEVPKEVAGTKSGAGVWDAQWAQRDSWC